MMAPDSTARACPRSGERRAQAEARPRPARARGRRQPAGHPRPLALLDFGLLGRLDEETRTTLALLLLALAQNRSEDVAALLLSLSLTTLDSDEPAFVHELRRKLPRYHWRPLSAIGTGEALADLQRICL
jgi:predicted unusual protein kinase regulating ubiquinone biosynthesis (AarF/ABC1/UbiB family)